MLLAAIVAMLAAYVAVRDDGGLSLVAAATRDLPAGATFSPTAVAVTEVRVDEHVAATLLLTEQLADVDGWVLTQPVPAGGLVPLEALRPPSAPSSLRAMSLPIPADRAVAGGIERGDRIDVIEVRDDGAVYVATDLEVLAVGRPDAGPASAAGGFTVTVAVDEATALRLARAVDSSGVHVVRATGASPATAGEGLAPRPRGLGPGALRTPAAGDASSETGTGGEEPAP